MISEPELRQQNGILLVDKCKGWTSHDVVNLIRRRFGFKKVGHCGTLDPAATGLLVIVIGKATKISENIMNGYKIYKAKMILGKATDSQDATGEYIAEASYKHISSDQIHQCLQSLIGEIQQIPPMVSALKHKGQPLYKLARKGIKVERNPRTLKIYNIEVNQISLPEVEFTVTCSKGTYIRTLCDDIGKLLNSYAYMSDLIRLRSGNFSLSDAFPIEKIKEVDLRDLSPFIIPLTNYLDYHKIHHTSSLDELVYHGIKKIALAIGNFDGIHLGHQKILKKLCNQARIHNSFPFILTFNPHPKTVLTGEKISKINSLQQQIDGFQQWGIDGMIHIPFCQQFSQQSPQEFIDNILINEKIEITDICIGKNWGFGANKKGNAHLLKEKLQKTEIYTIDEIFIDNQPISSSNIRQLIKGSKFGEVVNHMGRSYSIEGYVEYGLQLANNQLLYPTANIHNHTYLPLQGVFLVEVFWKENFFKGICNIGYTPTLNKQSCDYQKVEVHILDFDQDIYGDKLSITPIHKIREEKKFYSLEELQEQIFLDQEKALEILKK